MPIGQSRLTRIGVFYDGGFLHHVSSYYTYYHERRSRISISGLHQFVRREVSEREGSDLSYCQIVDAHYYRGRLRAQEAEERDLLRRERSFDDVLMREGVTTHYLPMSREGEKGVDVLLALDVFELAIHKQFDVVALVACDGDFLPLVRKLHSLGVRVMILAWDFEYVDRNGVDRETRTAQVLLDEATYPVMMQNEINDRARRNDPLITSLFVPRQVNEPATDAQIDARESAPATSAAPENGRATTTPDGICGGQVQAIKQGYGFITPDNGLEKNLFFYHSDVDFPDFNDLRVADKVEFELGENDRGQCAKRVRRTEAFA